MSLEVSTEPLNPGLYERLRCRFETVHVVNPGQPRLVMYVADHGRTGKVRAVVHETGEQYRVDCPFCFDQGQNLYVSYAYGQCDPNTGSNNYRQWHCKNARCHKDKECCARLREHTAIRFCYVARELAAANASGEHVNGSPLVTAPIPSLPEAVLFNDLREDHPAWAYLKARGFYPSHLSSGWGSDTAIIPSISQTLSAGSSSRFWASATTNS